MGRPQDNDFKRGVRRGLGLDYKLIGTWAGMQQMECECEVPTEHSWMGVCEACGKRLRTTPYFDVGQLARLTGHGEAKVAITMKYAVQEGYANAIRDTPRGQTAWTLTEKGMAAFPLSGYVEQTPEPVVGEHGVFTPLSPDEVRAQAPRAEEGELLSPEDRKQLEKSKGDYS